VFIFIVGMVLFATLALLPPLLQDLLNYPVVTTGLVTAPRGVGTLAAIFFVGRIMSLAAIPLVLLLRKGRDSAEPVHIE
jgi:DHA2 family multidrug resistance protein